LLIAPATPFFAAISGRSIRRRLIISFHFIAAADFAFSCHFALFQPLMLSESDFR
jgi:hypothetical protein